MIRVLLNLDHEKKFILEVSQYGNIRELKERAFRFLNTFNYDLVFENEILNREDNPLSYYGIKDGSRIFVKFKGCWGRIEGDGVNQRGGGGWIAGGGGISVNVGISQPSYGINLADLTNEDGLIKKNFGPSKEWNEITEGLNISGKCKNTDCVAYSYSVDCPIGLGTFDVVASSERIKCPMCKWEFDAETCTFCECYYKKKEK